MPRLLAKSSSSVAPLVAHRECACFAGFSKMSPLDSNDSSREICLRLTDRVIPAPTPEAHSCHPFGGNLIRKVNSHDLPHPAPACTRHEETTSEAQLSTDLGLAHLDASTRQVRGGMTGLGHQAGASDARAHLCQSDRCVHKDSPRVLCIPVIDNLSTPSQGLVVLLLADKGSCSFWVSLAQPPPCCNG